jgi:hypothetical protein
MHGSRSKIPSKKNLVWQRYAEGFNSGIKGLTDVRNPTRLEQCLGEFS